MNRLDAFELSVTGRFGSVAAFRPDGKCVLRQLFHPASGGLPL